jgi:hypothetical protein
MISEMMAPERLSNEDLRHGRYSSFPSPQSKSSFREPVPIRYVLVPAKKQTVEDME